MTLRGALLSFRIQRFESTVVVMATLLSVGVSAIVMTLFYGGGYATCFGREEPVLSSLCQSAAAEWLHKIARVSLALVPIFPIIGGFLVGGPIVAKELETGTARLAWSLGPSRLRWFAGRFGRQLEQTAKGHDPVFSPWHALAALPEAEFGAKAA